MSVVRSVTPGTMVANMLHERLVFARAQPFDGAWPSKDRAGCTCCSGNVEVVADVVVGRHDGCQQLVS